MLPEGNRSVAPGPSQSLRYVNGTQGIAAAAASAVLLLVGWGVTGVVYGKLLDGQGGEATG